MLSALTGMAFRIICLVLVLLPAPVFAASLADIRERGRLIVAVKDNTPPLGFRDPANQLQGFEIDIARRLAQEILHRSNALELRPVRNEERLRVVTEGTVDLTIARVTATPSRSRVVTFSLPYYFDGTALVTRDATIRRPYDIGPRTIAVLNGSSTIPVLKYRLPGATLTGVSSYQVGQDLLEQGGAVAFAADISILSHWVREFPQYRLVADRLSVEPLCIVLPKGLQYEPLRRQVNDALGNWMEEGWLQERATYWGLPWGNLEVAPSGKFVPKP